MKDLCHVLVGRCRKYVEKIVLCIIFCCCWHWECILTLGMRIFCWWHWECILTLGMCIFCCCHWECINEVLTNKLIFDIWHSFRVTWLWSLNLVEMLVVNSWPSVLYGANSFHLYIHHTLHCYLVGVTVCLLWRPCDVNYVLQLSAKWRNHCFGGNKQAWQPRQVSYTSYISDLHYSSFGNLIALLHVFSVVGR